MNNPPQSVIEKAIQEVRRLQQEKTTQAVIDCLMERHPGFAPHIDTKALWAAARLSLRDHTNRTQKHVR